MTRTWITILATLCQSCLATYYSQCEQDKIIHENYFWNVRSGVFVDIGAHDGISYSNTYFFEKELGWGGLCIEPMPETYAQLVVNRTCTCFQGCVAEFSGDDDFYRVSHPIGYIEMYSGLVKTYHPKHLENMKGMLSRLGGSLLTCRMKCISLNDLLAENQVMHVNVLSIDTEGGEFEILSSVDFSRYQVDVIVIEDNYGDDRLIPFLEEKGYRFIKSIEQDLLFVHYEFNPQSKRGE
jgi:FkbM family methyltransferase